MKEHILFTMRCRITEKAITWLEENTDASPEFRVQPSPFNVVTAINAIGCLKEPGERIKKMNRKLKAKIIEHYGTQWEFSKYIGLHEAAVSRIVRNRRELSQVDQKKWAKALKSDPKDIFNLEK